MKFLLTLLLFLLPLAALAGGTDTEFEEGIIKVEVTGVSSRDFFVRFSSDTLYLPCIQFCNYLRVIQSTSERMDTLRGELPAGRPFLLTSSGTIQDDSVIGSFPARWYRVIDGEIYVRDSVLAAAMGIRYTFSLDRLEMAIAPDARIPLVSLKRDSRRYGRLSSTKQGEAVRGDETISINRSLFGSVMLDWTLNGLYEESVSGENLRYQGGSANGTVGLSTPLLFGNLMMSGRGTYDPRNPERNLVGIGSVRWGVILPELSWLTRFNVGAELIARAGAPRLFQAELNNIPLAGRDHLGFHDLTGETNPGWTVEMYDGLQLVEVTQADSVGRYRFNIPVGYGTITRSIHSVGPHAERIVEERTLQFNQSLLPAGEIEYSVRGAAESLDPDSLFHGGMNLRAGVLPWLSLGTESSVRLRPSAGSAGFADSVNPVLTADLWTGGVSAVGIRYNPKASALWTSADWMPAEGVTLRAAVDSLALSDMTFSAAARGSYGSEWGYFSLGGGYKRTPSGSAINAMPQVLTSLYGVNLGLTMQMQWSAVTSQVGASLATSSLTRKMTTAFQIGSMLIPECRVQLKGVYDHIAGSLASISAQTDIRLYRTVGIGLSYSVNDLDWKTGSAGVVLTVGLGGISTSIFGTRSGEATGYAALGTMQGGAQISSAGLDFTQTTSGGQPQLIVQAFRDDNDNGLRDGGEIELDAPAVTVRQGNNVIQGRNRLFLSPYRESHIEVDPGSYLSQGLYPSRANFDIYTQQGTVEVITVPFSVGIDVTGSCEVHPAAGNPRRITTSAINGLRVTLESVDGSAEYDGEIFSDGTLLVSGVRQGRYSIALDPEQLAERDLTAESVPEEITIDLERQTVPTLLLIPATH